MSAHSPRLALLVAAAVLLAQIPTAAIAMPPKDLKDIQENPNEEDPLEPDDLPPRAPESAEERRVAGWTMVGAGLVFTLSGFAALRAADQTEEELIDTLVEGNSSTTRIEGLRDQRDNFEALTLIGLIGGVSLASAGGLLLLSNYRQSNPTPRTVSWAPWFSPDGGGLVLEADF